MCIGTWKVFYLFMRGGSNLSVKFSRYNIKMCYDSNDFLSVGRVKTECKTMVSFKYKSTPDSTGISRYYNNPCNHRWYPLPADIRYKLLFCLQRNPSYDRKNSLVERYSNSFLFETLIVGALCYEVFQWTYSLYSDNLDLSYPEFGIRQTKEVSIRQKSSQNTAKDSVSHRVWVKLDIHMIMLQWKDISIH